MNKRIARTAVASTVGRLATSLFLLILLAVQDETATADDPTHTISAVSKAVRDRVNLKSPDGCSHIYGFNYQPSWGHDGLTVWGEKFDARKYREELTLGKKYFPKFNAVRIWLSWSAYRANPERFVCNFQQAVDICGELDLLAMPVIFNRWTGNPLWDRVEDPEIAASFETTFAPFVQALVVPRKGDLRIFAWDLCNEPPLNAIGELQWLDNVRKAVKQIDGNALTCIGTVTIEQTAACAKYADILTPHLYLNIDCIKNNVEPYCQLARSEGKPVISSECCWGSLVDAERVETVRHDLAVLKQNKIGFLPHALFESPVADLHRPQYGPVDSPGYMAFINMDGSLRHGHEVYNEFTE